MKTVSLISGKGGAGKTTAATILAVAGVQAGLSTVLIDLNFEQASACKWSDRRGDDEPPETLDLSPARLRKVLDQARVAGVDLAIIDTAPRLDEPAKLAAQNADLVLVPAQASMLDLETLASTMSLIGHDRRVQVLLTRVASSGIEEARDVAKQLAEERMEVCPIMLGDRVAYRRAAALGRTPTEHWPRSKAAEECAALYDHVSRLVGLPARRLGG